MEQRENDPVTYVRELEIEAFDSTFNDARGDLEPAEVKIKEDVEQSFINAKSMVSFVSEVSAERRSDVLNSVLLAQLAANKKFPNEEQMIEWYKEFVETLNKMGWVIEGAEFSKFESATNIFEVENVIIDLLTTAFGGTFKVVITETLKAIKGLSDDDGKLKVFEKNTHSLSKGAFQIGLASEKNGVVFLQLGTFLLTSSNQIKRILFFKSTKDQTQLYYCSKSGTLNEDIYSRIRSQVQEKLSTKTTDFIAEIEI